MKQDTTWLKALLLMAVAALVATAAEGAVLAVDDDDKQVSLEIWTGADEEATATIRLWARGGNVTSFEFLISKDPDPSESLSALDRERVELVAGATRQIQEDHYNDVKLRVGGFEEPGDYRGKVSFFQPAIGGTESEATVSVTVSARERPVVERVGGAEKVDLRIVESTGGLARRLVPWWESRSTVEIALDNRGHHVASLEEASLVLIGKDSESIVNDALVLKAALPLELPAQTTTTLVFDLNRDKLPPEAYAGDVRLAIQDLGEPISVALDLKVRVGPWPVLIAILFGILLGRLFKYMQERGQPLADALVRINRLQHRAESLAPDDGTIVNPMVDEIRDAAYREELEGLDQRMAAVETRIGILEQVRRIEAIIAGITTPEAQAARDTIDKIRRHVELRQDADAQTSLRELQGSLDNLRSSAANTLGSAAFVSAVQMTDRAIKMGERVPSFDSRRGARAKRALRSFLASVTGLSDQLRAETTLWVARPLLYVALIVGLVAVGVSTLYLEAGDTLGARPLQDYLGLILWGLSSDVAGRTLSNLRPTG